jgi:hypothetical protein
MPSPTIVFRLLLDAPLSTSSNHTPEEVETLHDLQCAEVSLDGRRQAQGWRPVAVHDTRDLGGYIRLN